MCVEVVASVNEPLAILMVVSGPSNTMTGVMWPDWLNADKIQVTRETHSPMIDTNGH